jgi:hypothetical protein
MNISNKKTLPILVLVFLVGVLGYQAISVRNAQAAADSPVGHWTITVTPDGGEAFIDTAIFSSDGTLVVSESGDIGLGVWQKLSGNRFAFTFWEVYEQDGAFYHSKVSSTIKLQNGKEQYTGPFIFQISDADGNLIIEGYGTAVGVRNHVELMP